MNKVYVKLIGAAVAVTMVISLFSAIGVVFKLSENGQILCQITAFAICGAFIFAYMKKKDRTLKEFGFKREYPNKWLGGFMLATVLIQPLILGIDFTLSFSTIGLIAIQMLLVGFVEETLFRGIFFYLLKSKSPKVFIIYSSVVFGFLHIASSLNPETPLLMVILQIVNALLLGVVFSVIYYTKRSTYLVIIFHAVFNLFASITPTGSLEQNILAVSILSIGYVIFLVFLTKAEFFKKVCRQQCKGLRITSKSIE